MHLRGLLPILSGMWLDSSAAQEFFTFAMLETTGCIQSVTGFASASLREYGWLKLGQPLSLEIRAA